MEEAVEEAPTSQETLDVPEGSMDVSDSEVGGGLGDAGVGGMSSGNVAPEFGDGVKVNPETVSMEIQVPTEQLASAVAQATGDVVPAETAPDVEMAKENELVAQEQEEAEPSMEGGEASSPLEAEPSMGEESMEQSVPVDSLSTEEPQPQPMGESKKKKLSPSKKVDLKFKKKLDSIINKGVENMAKSLKESEEDFEVEMPEGLKIDGDSVYYNGEYVGFIGNSKNCIYVSTEDCKEAEDYFLAKDWIVKEKYDFGKPIYESEEPKDRDFEEDFEEDSEIEEEYSEDLPEGYENEGMRDESLEGEFQDVSDADVSEFMGRLQGYLDSEETTPQDVSDALRTSADFMDMVGGNTSSNTPLMDSIRDSDDLDFDSLIDGDYEDGEVRDAVEEEPVRRAPRDFDDDFEEALVRKPCKFPKDRTSIKESRNRKAQRLQETIEKELADMQEKIDGNVATVQEVRELVNVLQNQFLELAKSIVDLLHFVELYTDKIGDDVYERLKELVNEWSTNLPPVTCPVDGNLETINIALAHVYNSVRRGLTAGDFDALLLTAKAFDSFEISALEYDTRGSDVFAKWKNWYMVSPFNGEYVPIESVVQKLADLHKLGITAQAYDAKDLHAVEYDADNISAYSYDWNNTLRV